MLTTSGGLLTDLEPIAAARVQLQPASGSYRDYRILIDGRPHEPSEVLHFTYNPDPLYLWKGRGITVTLKDVARNLRQAQETENAFMRSEWKPSIIVKVDGLTEEFASPEGRDKLLESYVKKTPYLNLKGTYNSAIQAMKDLRESPVQLLFLDIQMPELSGIEFAKVLPKDTKIIFTTAFSQYAIDGYKVNALDYLLKPISYDDFLKSTDKALDRFYVTMKQEIYQRDRFMLVKGGEKVLSLMSMKKLDEYLPKPEFLRTHRSYIVHMTEIPLVDRFRIVFDDVYIPISENYKEEVQDYFDQHTLV